MKTTAENVLSIVRDLKNYSVQIDYCHPERITEKDKEEIRQSAEHFRKYCGIEEIEEAIEGMENEGLLTLASIAMNYHADHMVYNTVSVYLIPTNQ